MQQPARNAFAIGGQAVLEGVMMRGPSRTSTAVRRASGEIVADTREQPSLLVRSRWFRLPVVRGVIVLYEALTIGVRALVFSANAQLEQEGHELSGREVALSMALGLGLAVLLFFVLPTLVIRLVDRQFHSTVAMNLAEGGVRVSLVVAYIAFVGRFPDLARVFMYHGAEHKAVNCLEAGESLTVEGVRRHSRFHPRCGTSFLLVVMVVAVLVFSFLGRPPLVARIASRVVLIPLVAGLSYEVIRAGARYRWFRPLVAPGMWLQRLTTREPDDRQIEVAIAALRNVLDREPEVASEPALARVP